MKRRDFADNFVSKSSIWQELILDAALQIQLLQLNCSFFAYFHMQPIIRYFDISTFRNDVAVFIGFAYKVKILMILMYPNSSLIGK